MRIGTRAGLLDWSAGALSLLTAGTGLTAPRVDRAVYGVTPEGVQVHSFMLSNDRGVSVKILDMGGVVTELNVPDRKGEIRNVVLGLGDLNAYRATSTMNALIGRYANRLKDGFEIDGHHYAPAANAKGVTLHGGTAPYGARMWNAAPIIEPTAAAVSLSLVSPDGDQGFPGTLTIRVVYSLTDTDDFKIEYEAKTDRTTVVNLTNHLYFNLAGNGSGTVYGQELQVFADLFTPTDEDLIPTGRLEPVAGTALDFREPRRIGARVASSEPQMLIARGYDHNFVLRKPGGDPLPLAARLFDPISGRIMEVRTTEPGLQVYSSNFMTGALVSAAGTTIRQGDGLALETQHFPNSPNNPGFPSTMLGGGGTLHSTTVFHFVTDDGRALH
jgi:aldose 1-epimerase